MEHAKQKRLEKSGWRVGSTAEFLGLSGVEEALVDMKLTLGKRLRKTREQHKLTQINLAKRMGSSQSRVAKMEAGDSTCWSKGYWQRELPAEKSAPHWVLAGRLPLHNVSAFSCGRQSERSEQAREADRLRTGRSG